MALGDLKIRIGIDATGIEKGLRNAQKKLEKSASRFAAIGSNISMGISAPLGLLGAQAINTAAEFETLEMSLSVLAGSAEEGKKAFERLKEFSASTPFQLQELVAANNQMMGFGMTADQAFDSLGRLGDVAAVMGSSVKDLGVVFSKARASGRLMTEDLNELGDRMPVYEMLGEITNKTVPELRQMAEDGKLSFDVLQQGLEQATNEGGKFFEGTKKGAQTIGGILSTFRDNLSLALGTLGKSIADAINFKEVMAKLSAVIGRVTNFFANLSDGAKKIIIAIVGTVAALGPLLFGLGSLTNIVVSAISGLRVLNSVLLANPFGLIAAAIAAVVIAFRQLYKHSNAFRGVVNKLVTTVKNTFKKAFDAAKQVVNALRVAFAGTNKETKRTKTGFKAIAEFIGKVVVGVLQKFADHLKFIVELFVKLYNSSERFRGVLFAIVFSVKTMISETLQGLSKLGDAIVLLFDRKFKEAGETAAEGAKQFGMAGIEGIKALAEGYRKGVESELRLGFDTIKPEDVVPDEEEIKDKAKDAGKGAAQTIAGEFEREMEKLPKMMTLPDALARNVETFTQELQKRFSNADLPIEPKTVEIKPQKVKLEFFLKGDAVKGLLDHFDIGGSLMGKFNELFDAIANNEWLNGLGENLKAGIMLGVGALDIFNQNFTQTMQAQQTILDKNHAAEIARIEAGTASEEVKQARKAQAEKIYEKKSQAIKRRQARREKMMAMFEATVHMAAGIIQAYPNLPLMALGAALGAAQIATIAATPIPMAKGGILTGPTNILAGEYMGARNNPEIIAPLDKLKNLIGGQTNINLQGAFRLTGNDLILAVEQANKNRIRQGGQSIF